MDRIRFYKSIHVKIVIIYMLLILIAMQVIGVYFTQQLENHLVRSFYETLDERQSLLNYNIEQEMIRDVDDEERSLQNRIDSILRELIPIDNTEVQVVDQNSVLLSVTNAAQSVYVGQRTSNLRIQRAVMGNPTDEPMQNANGHRTRVMAVPIESEGQIIGALYIEASMQEIYEQMTQINQILFTGTIIALAITAGLGIFLSRTISRPIVDMRKQALVMGKGDFTRSVTVYGNDEIGQLAVSFNDLTKKLQDANATTEAERRKLSSVLTHMTDGVVATDKYGKVILINRRAEEMLGTPQDEVANMDVTKLLNLDKFLKLEDLYNFIDPILLDFDSEKEEDEMVLQAHFSIIEKENGQRNGLIAVLHDVTEQEQVETERREFVANVSHELRTPLTSMKSYLEALEDGALDDPEIAPRFIRVTATETDRMIRLVNDLLQLSKMDSKDYYMMIAPVDITQFVEQIVERFEMTNKNESIEFKRKIPQRPITVRGDRDKLTQLMDNILSNAVKYSPEGGKISITVRLDKEQVVVSVKDEGVGIPKENLRHVFDRFYRVDKARSRNLGGTGLGLAIAREIIQAHGGHIWVSSEWKRGTTFFFSLPYAGEEEASDD